MSVSATKPFGSDTDCSWDCSPRNVPALDKSTILATANSLLTGRLDVIAWRTLRTSEIIMSRQQLVAEASISRRRRNATRLRKPSSFCMQIGQLAACSTLRSENRMLPDLRARFEEMPHQGMARLVTRHAPRAPVPGTSRGTNSQTLLLSGMNRAISGSFGVILGTTEGIKQRCYLPKECATNHSVIHFKLVGNFSPRESKPTPFCN